METDDAERATRWFETLSTGRQHQLRHLVGPLPNWATESLREASIAPISAAAAHGDQHEMWLLPTLIVEAVPHRHH